MTIGNAPIVVGVNGTRASDKALRWAMDEATLRNCPLHVVHAWISEPLVDWNETSARNELSLWETLVDAAVRAALIGRVQPPEIERRSLRGDAAEVLEEASQGRGTAGGRLAHRTSTAPDRVGLDQHALRAALVGAGGRDPGERALGEQRDVGRQR